MTINNSDGGNDDDGFDGGIDRITRADGTEVFLRNPPGQSGVVELTLDEHVDMWAAMLASYDRK